jgi:hypothetical protein
MVHVVVGVPAVWHNLLGHHSLKLVWKKVDSINSTENRDTVKIYGFTSLGTRNPINDNIRITQWMNKQWIHR